MKTRLARAFKGWETLVLPALLCVIFAGLLWAEDMLAPIMP